MSAQSPSPQPPNVERRKRKAPPRRTPAIIEQRERKPFLFGWGADLDRRQREAFKERIALFAGIGIAVVLAFLLGWGWYQDNVAGPARTAAANNKPVAIVGNYTIRMGFYKRYAEFQKKQANNQLTQLQQQQQQLSSDQKKNAAQLAQINLQVSQIQQQLSQIATIALNGLIDDQTVIQRSQAAGVTPTKKDVDNQMTLMEKQAGGRLALQNYIQQSGLSADEFRMLIEGDYLRQKVSKKLAAHVPHVQTEVRASHILISDKKKSLAEKLYRQVKGGANIAPLAKKYSTDKGSALKGGDLGYAVPSTYVTSFAKAVSSMKAGDVRLVHSQYGWHIIKVTGRKKVRLSMLLETGMLLL